VLVSKNLILHKYRKMSGNNNMHGIIKIGNIYIVVMPLTIEKKEANPEDNGDDTRNATMRNMRTRADDQRDNRRCL
jgi:hypothetical protein